MAWSEAVFIYERAKPLSRLILEWSNDQGIQVIHAGLVSRHGKGVLFVARSGSGKSTASLACLCSGFDFAGDDFVGLQRLRDGSFIGHSLYNSVFLETEHLARFPELEPFAIPGGSHEEKAAVILSQVFPERLRTHISIQAVVLPRVADGQESLFGGIPKSQALLAMAPSSLIEIPSRGMESLIEIPSRGMEGFERLAQLVEQVPTFEMRLGRDLKTIPECVDKLITSLPHF
jgi:serine kinase of HPr protein (carbohydrate metabolism regulator)